MEWDIQLDPTCFQQFKLDILCQTRLALAVELVNSPFLPEYPGVERNYPVWNNSNISPKSSTAPTSHASLSQIQPIPFFVFLPGIVWSATPFWKSLVLLRPPTTHLAGISSYVHSQPFQPKQDLCAAKCRIILFSIWRHIWYSPHWTRSRTNLAGFWPTLMSHRKSRI